MAITKVGDQVTKILTIQVDSEKAISTLRQLNDTLEDVRSQERELTKEIKENTETQKYSEEEIERKKQELQALKQAERDYSAQVSEVTRVVQKELQADRSKEGSLKQLRAQLSMLTKQYDELSREEREGAKGEELLQHINDLTTEIKDAEYASQRFQRNVGNYPGAMEPVKQQLRELTQALIQMRAEGKQNTAEYQEMMAKAGQLKDAMDDTSSEIKQMASDTSALNSVLDGAKLAAGGFSAALGAMELIGSKDSETAQELVEAQKKLQSAIAITTGLQAVQNALQKESALMMGITKIQTLAAAKAQDLNTAATGRATIAQRLFNAVAKANPYVLLAMAVLTVVGALVAFTRGTKEAEEQEEELNSQLEEQVELLKRLKSAYDSIYQSYNKSLENRIELLKAEGASIEEVRAAEDALAEAERKRIEAREAAAANDLANFDEYVHQLQEAQSEYEDYNNKVIELETRLSGTLSENDEANLQRFKELREVWAQRVDDFKKMVDALSDIQIERDNFDNQMAIRQAKREKEDEERRQKAAKAAADRRKKELEEQRKYEALVQSEMQKAEDALNALIENEFEQRRAIENTSYQRQLQTIQQAMEEEKRLHGENTQLYASYLQQIEALGVKHERTMSDIAQDQYNNEIELQQNALRILEADRELYWQNRINELIAQGQDAGQVELEALKDTLDNLTQYADESDAEFYARRLAAQQAYNEKKKALNDAEIAMEKAKAEYMQNIAGSISSLLETVAGDNKALVKASKIAALAEVAIKQGVAIAEAVASAAAGDPYTYALRVASAIASTVSAMAEAISSINSVKLARGTGFVKGPGTSTSDSIPAMLSLGEGVANARGNALFPGLIDAINAVGNGMSVPVQNQTSYSYNTVANAAGGITPDQIAEAMKQMPPSEVAVSEIKRVNDRIDVIENLRNN